MWNHKEGLYCPSSGDINRLMMIFMHTHISFIFSNSNSCENLSILKIHPMSNHQCYISFTDRFGIITLLYQLNDLCYVEIELVVDFRPTNHSSNWHFPHESKAPITLPCLSQALAGPTLIIYIIPPQNNATTAFNATEDLQLYSHTTKSHYAVSAAEH
jgi:hypothetical protein